MGRVSLRALLLFLTLSLIPACDEGGGGGASGGPGWGLETLIETNDAGNGSNPQVVMDSAGNATAVWNQHDGLQQSIWSNRYDQATGSWGTPVLLETDDAGFAVSPRIAVDPNGNVTAVWTQLEGTLTNIRSNRYDQASGTWGTAVLIETNNVGHAGFPAVAVDPAGNATAVWQQDGDPTAATRKDVWSNRYDQASGTWGTAVLIETNDVGEVLNPKVGVDSSGNAIAVWRQDGDPAVAVRNDVWANEYDQASGTWGIPQLLETDDAGEAEFPEVAVDLAGNATAVWYQFDGALNSIYANRYDQASGTWGGAQLIEMDNTGGAYDPHIAVDPVGNMTAVWELTDGSPRSIMASRYDIATGTWGTRVPIETDPGGAGDPFVAVAATGDAMVVWIQFDGSFYNLWSNRYDALSGTWGTAVLVEGDTTASTLVPQVAVDSVGNATAVWYRDGDPAAGVRNDIWANRYE